MSFVGIQVFRALLVVLTPLAISLQSSRFRALPFACVTTGGLHPTYFDREYCSLVDRFTTLVPPCCYFFAPARKPAYYLPLGLAYMVFSALCILAIIFSGGE